MSYFLSGGEMLDMTGASEGGTPGVRAYDHRQIGEVYPDSYPEVESYMRDFMRQTGAIRVHYSGDLCDPVLASLDVSPGRDAPSDTALRQLVDISSGGLELDLWTDNV
jgi:hypothetical protein